MFVIPAIFYPFSLPIKSITRPHVFTHAQMAVIIYQSNHDAERNQECLHGDISQLIVSMLFGCFVVSSVNSLASSQGDLQDVFQDGRQVNLVSWNYSLTAASTELKLNLPLSDTGLKWCDICI